MFTSVLYTEAAAKAAISLATRLIGLTPKPTEYSHAPVLARAYSLPPTGTTAKPLTVYAVDDLPRLTDLYANLLREAGYGVCTFNHRGDALAALQASKNRPDLLISDYLGLTMPVNDFLQGCRLLHPRLRILVASGFTADEMRFTGVQPDFFLHKPFTPAEFQQAVKAALTGESVRKP